MNIRLNYKILGIALLIYFSINIIFSFIGPLSRVFMIYSWVVWLVASLFIFCLHLLDSKQKPAIETPTIQGRSKIADISYSVFLAAISVIIFYFLPNSIVFGLNLSGEVGFGIAMFQIFFLIPITIAISSVIYYKILKNIGTTFVRTLIKLLVVFLLIPVVMIIVSRLSMLGG